MTWDGYPQRQWAKHPPEFWAGILLYLLFGTTAAMMLRNLEIQNTWRIAIGLAPTLPMLLIVRGYLRMVRQQDELYRRVQLEAIAIAAGLTIVFAFTAWFLEAFGLIMPVSIQWAGVVLFFSYGIAAGLLMVRYT